jgi:ribulose-phosphate 3-epimerase
MKHLVSPSILTADLGNLEKVVKLINGSQADWIHLDIMDGVFVPNISFGFPVVEYVHKIAEKPLDVHLMITDPDRYLLRFRDAGANILTVHYEACTHLHRTVNEIRNLGMKAGVAVNPHTPVHLLKHILSSVDMILIMTVNPGFGGQKFINECYGKITELKKMISEGDHNILIEVDGGIDSRNASGLVGAGVDVLVSGNSIFSATDPEGYIIKLKELIV